MATQFCCRAGCSTFATTSSAACRTPRWGLQSGSGSYGGLVLLYRRFMLLSSYRTTNQQWYQLGPVESTRQSQCPINVAYAQASNRAAALQSSLLTLHLPIK